MKGQNKKKLREKLITIMKMKNIYGDNYYTTLVDNINSVVCDKECSIWVIELM